MSSCNDCIWDRHSTISNPKREISDVTQHWYADDARYLGTFAIIETYFDSLTRQVPGRGYYPKPSKSILVVHPDHLEARKEFGSRHGFKLCTGAHYFGGCIGDDKSKSDWMRENTLMWEKNINTISKIAGKCPQDSYPTVVNVIQAEWIFLQCVTWNIGDAFAGVEKMIWETFLPHLLFRKTKTLSPIVGTLSPMPIKVAGLCLLNPVTSAK